MICWPHSQTSDWSRPHLCRFALPCMKVVQQRPCILRLILLVFTTWWLWITGGYYMFVNSSSSSLSVNSGMRRRALLISRALSVALSSQWPSQCLQLAYHLAGDACSLAVSVLSVDQTVSSIWRRNCDASDGLWHQLELSLNENKPFQVGCCSFFDGYHYLSNVNFVQGITAHHL